VHSNPQECKDGVLKRSINICIQAIPWETAVLTELARPYDVSALC
jgi:hypothetical protein